jgi:hypothetical protein
MGAAIRARGGWNGRGLTCRLRWRGAPSALRARSAHTQRAQTRTYPARSCAAVRPSVRGARRQGSALGRGSGAGRYPHPNIGVVDASRSGSERAMPSRMRCCAPTKKQRSWWILSSIAQHGESSIASSTPIMHWSSLPSDITIMARPNACSHKLCFRFARRFRASLTSSSTTGSLPFAEFPMYCAGKLHTQY